MTVLFALLSSLREQLRFCHIQAQFASTEHDPKSNCPFERCQTKAVEPYYVVTADWHLERFQYGLTTRFQDNLKCVGTIVDDVCNNPACQGMLIAGDNFHKRSLLPRYQMLFRQMVQRIHDTGKQVLAIDGNHDGSGDASWLDTVARTINANGRILDLKGERAAFFSFQPRDQLYQRICELPPNVRVLVLHGRLLELLPWAASQPEPDYDVSAKDLRDLGLKDCTVFLGDLHTYGDFHDPDGNNWFIYAGSPEMSEISEGNIHSDRFGNRYDTVKKYLRFYPARAHGQNWDLIDLPSRAYLKRIITPADDPELAIAAVDYWIHEHPQGILALHYPDILRERIASLLPVWREKLLVLFDTVVSTRNGKALQDLREADILDIARKELTPSQVEILQIVLSEETFDESLTSLLSQTATD